MLDIYQGSTHRFCDGLSRRNFLQVGALGLTALTLADLLRAETKQRGTRPKSIIYVVLGGGPSHIDMWDPKPDAPSEIRGPFPTIRTRLSGQLFTELMPQQAARLDRMALIQGVQSVENDHFLSEVYSGLPRTAGSRPAFGSVVSRLAGQGTKIPPYVSLNRATTDQFEFEKPVYAGAAHAPFRPFGEAVNNLAPVRSLDRLGDRKKLLATFDSLRRDLDQSGLFDGLDRFTAQALDLVTSPKVREAFDLSKESDRLLERYGHGGKYEYSAVKGLKYDWDGKQFVLARRLVEAGVRVVTLSVGSWDHHSGLPGSIFDSLKTQVPLFDRSIAALTDDLRDRGLEKDVLVVVLGEFGRTPKIHNPGPGREHHADAGSALFIGGGLKMGQVIGRTDRRGERAVTGKVTFQNVMATIYHVLGIDPMTRLLDFRGRPQHLLEERTPIAELDAPALPKA